MRLTFVLLMTLALTSPEARAGGGVVDRVLVAKLTDLFDF
jgi:hypothetical protein